MKKYRSFLILLFVLIACSAISYGEGRNNEVSGANNKASTALPGIISCIGTLLLGGFTYFTSRKMEKLKTDLATKMGINSQIFDYLMSLDKLKVTESTQALKEFINGSQKVKEDVRRLMIDFNNTIPKERNSKIELLTTTIIDLYANNAYTFASTDKDKFAHRIKNLYIEIFTILKSPAEFKPVIIENKIKEISLAQEALQSAIESEMMEILTIYKDKSTSNNL